MIEVNNGFAKAALESFLTSSSKVSEVGVKVANEALAPLSSCVETTVSKLTKPLAA